MVQVSVIVPVYNVQKYLAECLDSLVGQTFESKEIILVDDGSTDDSPAIARRYAERYPFVKVVRQPNAGDAAARNRGVLEASGKYAIFVDSDDFLELDTLATLYEAARRHDLDIVRGKSRYCDEAGKPLSIPEGGLVQPSVVMDGREYLARALEAKGYDIIPVVNLVKLSYLRAAKVTFREGANYADQEFTLKLLTSGAKRVMQLDYVFYWYRLRQGAVTSTPDFKKAKGLALVARKMASYVESSGFERRMKKFANMTVAIAGYHLSRIYVRLSRSDQKRLREVIDDKSFRKLLRHRTFWWRINVQNWIFAYMPLILRVLHKIKTYHRG